MLGLQQPSTAGPLACSVFGHLIIAGKRQRVCCPSGADPAAAAAAGASAAAGTGRLAAATADLHAPVDLPRRAAVHNQRLQTVGPGLVLGRWDAGPEGLQLGKGGQLNLQLEF